VEDAVSVAGPVGQTLDRIEAELAAVWAPSPADSGEPAKVRAALTNYIVLTPRSDLARWEEAADAVTATHPGRAIVLTIDGRVGAGDVEAETTAVCRFDDGHTPVCSDRITLVFGSLAAERTASFVRSLILPELPTVVEVAPGASVAVARALAGMAERLVLDTRGTNLALAVELAAATRGRVADRAWVRTYSVRELVARLFDGAVDELERVTRVTLARTAGGVDPAPLFLGWLGSRLGWTPRGPGRVDGPRGEVLIEVQETPRGELPEGVITAVHFDIDTGGASLRRSFERTGPAAARVVVQGPTPSAHSHALGSRDEAWVAEKVIDATEGDRVYRAALLGAQQFVGAQTKGARA
jgi:glucose-6-phosphate dehydrogenase assembly protein OpcA